MRHVVSLLVLSLVVALARPAVAVTLLTDNFSVDNNDASTFNDNNAVTQGGTLAPINYNLTTTSPGFVAQHGNGGRLLVANAGFGGGYGNVSLNNDFATNANSFGSPLTFSFNIMSVDSYADTSKWVQFNVGTSQNLDVGNGGVGLGVLFRQAGVADVVSSGSQLAGNVAWTNGDLVTITLSDSAGTGSAFNGNGSKATVSIGATNFGPFTLAPQSTAYATFSAYNYDNAFGLGTFDNLSIAVVPEPSMALFGVAAALGVAIRRRRAARAS